MSVAVCIPWRDGCPHRERALEWVRARYAERHPDWDLVVAEAPPGPWVKARAAMPAIAAMPTGTVVIVADADVWCDELAAAAATVESNVATWAVPHRAVWRLSETATAAALAGVDHTDEDLCERAYLGVYGGGFVIARRETLLEVPLDPRFVGWGQEDRAWGLSLQLLAGHPWRGKAPIIHLWHPPQERMNRKWGSPEGKALWKRYVAARRCPDRLRQILEEARAALDASQPAVHDYAPLGGR